LPELNIVELKLCSRHSGQRADKTYSPLWETSAFMGKYIKLGVYSFYYIPSFLVVVLRIFPNSNKTNEFVTFDEIICLFRIILLTIYYLNQLIALSAINNY
jgi:hypothetical protein